MAKDANTGNRNAGNRNAGNRNAGNRNAGNRNAGNRNAGSWNTGDCNAGSWNTGSWNTGNRNAGDCNAGSWNTGDCNAGSWNTGNRNAGDCNAGSWNTGDWNTGYCNSVTPEDCLIFNKPAKHSDWGNADKPDWMHVDLTQWVAESDMTDKEKEAYPSYVTTGGYLKHYTSLTQAYVESWEKASQEDRDKTRKLPNFDEEVFAEVFGFNPWGKKSCSGKVVEIDGVKYKLTEV